MSVPWKDTTPFIQQLQKSYVDNFTSAMTYARLAVESVNVGDISINTTLTTHIKTVLSMCSVLPNDTIYNMTADYFFQHRKPINAYNYDHFNTLDANDMKLDASSTKLANSIMPMIRSLVYALEESSKHDLFTYMRVMVIIVVMMRKLQSANKTNVDADMQTLFDEYNKSLSKSKAIVHTDIFKHDEI